MVVVRLFSLSRQINPQFLGSLLFIFFWFPTIPLILIILLEVVNLFLGCSPDCEFQPPRRQRGWNGGRRPWSWHSWHLGDTSPSMHNWERIRSRYYEAFIQSQLYSWYVSVNYYLLCIVLFWLLTCYFYTASAYDPNCSDFELKCLGGCSGVAEVIKKIVKTRNYRLFERLLAVVEAKSKGKV